ncbi:r2 protein [Lasius niger]|uniref:R2 protein n=1 Tax=Lasius niger TaxID=67767 RepID=A0A0J7NIU0_LASNI|nr:r2 protein [Lasius niger]
MLPKLHGVRCHYPKCKQIIPAKKEFQCAACAESFDTALGLSMHERHKHAEIRNRKRKEQAERPRQKAGRNLSVWTEEEVALLVRLNKRFKNDKYPNVRIKEHLPQKTLKQISDKRRTLIKNVNVPPEINEDSEQGFDVEIVEIQNPELVVPVEAQQPPNENMNIWKDTIKNHIIQSNINAEYFNNINKELRDIVSTKAIEAERLENIILQLEDLILKDEKEKWETSH